MKKTIHLLLTISLATLFFAGCSGNLFMDMGLETPPDFNANLSLTDSNVMDYIDTLDEVLQFPDGLSDSETTTVYDSLTFFATGTPDTAEEQAAAAAAGKLMIESNPDAKELVNNMAEAIDALMNDPDPDPEDIIASLVPESVMNDPDAFSAMIRDLMDAADAFNALGEGLGTSELIELPGNEPGGIAQMALVAIVVDTAVGFLDPAVPDPDGIDALYQMILDPATNSFDAGDDPFDELDTGNLANILTWAELETTF